MFTVGSAFVCFYHAERILSLLFVVHLLCEGEGQVKWEGRCRVRQWEEIGKVWRAGKWECMKTVATWDLGTPFLENFFRSNILCRR